MVLTSSPNKKYMEGKKAARDHKRKSVESKKGRMYESRMEIAVPARAGSGASSATTGRTTNVQKGDNIIFATTVNGRNHEP